MSKTILVVDDSKTIREMVKQTLTESCYTVVLANDGVDALGILNSCDPDAIVTDINMPRMDGFGLMTEVRKKPKFQRIPILVLTTESAEELKSRARLAGATGWIVKPFDSAKLLRALELVVR